MGKHLLIDNTSYNVISTKELNRALVEVMEDNIASMSHTIQIKDMDIMRLSMELEQTRKKIIAPIINTLTFYNFLACA